MGVEECIQFLAESAEWLEECPDLPKLLVAILIMLAGYWHATLRAYRTNVRPGGDRLRLLAPVTRALPVEAAPSGTDAAALTSFGGWVMLQLSRGGRTPDQLAQELRLPPEAVYAVLYGAPVGTFLPALGTVDAICAALQIETTAGRVLFGHDMTRVRGAGAPGSAAETNIAVENS